LASNEDGREHGMVDASIRVHVVLDGLWPKGGRNMKGNVDIIESVK